MPTDQQLLSRLTLVAGAKELTKLFATPDGGTAYDIAFHPHFADNGFVYIGWNSAPQGAEETLDHYAVYTMTTKSQYTIDTASRRRSSTGNRTAITSTAICLARTASCFVTSGDGPRLRHQPHGPATDHCSPSAAHRCRSPRGRQAYSIPKDNPFVGDRRFAPTWAYGLRNPWRISLRRRQTAHSGSA